MKAVHEPPLLVASGAPVFRDVIVDPRLDRGHAADHTGGHRHRVIGVEIRGLLGELFRGESLRLGEDGRGRLGACDHLRFEAGIVAEDGRITLRLGVADADALLDERVVALGELLDPVFAAAELVVEPHPFASNRAAALGGKLAFRLLARPHDRLPHADLDLASQTVSHRGIEVVGGEHGPLQVLEVGPRLVWIDCHQLPRIPQPHGSFLLELLAAHAAHRVELGEFPRVAHGLPRGCGRIAGWRGLSAGPGRCLRRGQRLELRSRLLPVFLGGIFLRCLVVGGLFISLESLESDRSHERSIDVVGVAPERSHRQPQGGPMGAGGLCLAGEFGERGRLAADRGASQIQSLAAEERQEDAVAVAGVSRQFDEERILLAGLRRRNLDGCRMAARTSRVFE